MKKIVVLLIILSLVLAFALSCGQKEAEETEKVPTEVKQAEQMDSTRMDSAAMDTMEMPADSM
jgi:PBP1b-binding outer membrane lipoprotein LpoB